MIEFGVYHMTNNHIATNISSSGRFEHIDALRALAVMLVVVAHAGLGHIVPGGSGVTVFFTISGFVITNLVLRERQRTGSFNTKSATHSGQGLLFLLPTLCLALGKGGLVAGHLVHEVELAGLVA
jgi:peptidoglycan/LPS O-acetylase OafA/YrhL